MNPTHGTTLFHFFFFVVAVLVEIRACCPRDACYPRYTIFKAFPPLCTCESRRPRGEMQAVPCGARSDARLFRPPARNLDPLRSAISGRIMRGSIFILMSKRYNCSTDILGDVQLSRKKRNTGSRRRFRSCLDEREPARRPIAGFPLSAPTPTYPRRGPGQKRPRAAHPRTPH